MQLTMHDCPGSRARRPDLGRNYTASPQCRTEAGGKGLSMKGEEQWTAEFPHQPAEESAQH